MDALRKELYEMVIEEVINLKNYATAEEISRLDYKTFKPDNPFKCIYGQLAFNCYTDRAIDLLNLCAVPYVENNEIISRSKNNIFIYNRRRDLSALEYYVADRHISANANKNIIKYLKNDYTLFEKIKRFFTGNYNKLILG